MLKVSDIREFILLMDETSLQELSLETDALKLTLKKAPVVQTVSSMPIVSEVVEGVHAASTTSISAGSMGSAPAMLEVDSSDEAVGLAIITSPMVGTFYRAPSPATESYVEVGSIVTDKSVVCIVEAMKLMNEIEADVCGEIIEILVVNGQLVEFGQPLFRVKLA